MRAWVVSAAMVLLLPFAGCRKKAPAAASPTHFPTQVLEGFDLQERKDGKPSMTLDAAQGRIYEAEHSADLDMPVVTFYKEGKVSSVMKAPIGKVDTLTHAIEAWNGVTVISSDSTTLTTERMNYDPVRRKIISHTHVKLVKPDSVTEGESLEADPELTSVLIRREKVKTHQGTMP
jgi:LPS export ABC transporter protein LptC